MRAWLAVVPIAAVALACADTPARRLQPSFDEAMPGTELSGGCPGKFSVGVKASPKTHNYVGRDPADDNLDKVVCYLVTKDAVLDDLGALVRPGVVVMVDNNVPAHKIGKCPVSFTAVAVFAAAEDRNGNSVVCKARSEEAGVALTDDNDS